VPAQLGDLAAAAGIDLEVVERTDQHPALRVLPGLAGLVADPHPLHLAGGQRPALVRAVVGQRDVALLGQVSHDDLPVARGVQPGLAGRKFGLFADHDPLPAPSRGGTHRATFSSSR
jgi:hypothetical protein